MDSLTCFPQRHEFKVFTFQRNFAAGRAIVPTQEKKFLYSLWTKLKWLKITHFLIGKLQTTAVEDRTSEMT